MYDLIVAILYGYFLVVRVGQVYTGQAPSLEPSQVLTGIYRTTPSPSGATVSLPSLGATAATNIYAEVSLGNTSDGGTVPQSGGTAGVSITRAFPFAFNTPNLLTGAEVYTPTIGDILLDAWIEIDIAWNGTTPKGDFGLFVDTNFGFFGYTYRGAVSMIFADYSGALWPGMLSQDARIGATTLLSLSADIANVSGGLAVVPARFLPAKFVGDDPIKVVVSQDGTNTGADPGSTQGAAILYLVTCTPVGPI